MPIFTVRNLVYTNIIEGDAFRNRRNFGNQNVSKFRKKLKAQNWNAVYTAENAQINGLYTIYKYYKTHIR